MTNIIKLTHKRDTFNYEEFKDFIRELEDVYLEDLEFLNDIKKSVHITKALVCLKGCIVNLKKVKDLNTDRTN